MKLTGWYRGDQKPVREGVYERELPWGEIGYALYMNGIWRTAFGTPFAALSSTIPSEYQNLPWRGMTK